jgi:signal transduction histidine kinase
MALWISDAQFDYTPLPWPWWPTVVYSANGIGTMLILRFSMAVMGVNHSRLRKACDWFMYAIVPTIALATLLHWPKVLLLTFGVNTALGLAVTVMIVPRGLRSGELDKQVLSLGMILVAAAAVRDVVVFKILPGYSGVIWTVYAWSAFGISLAWIVAEQMRNAANELVGMNQLMARRLESRELELNAVHARQAAAERQNAMIEERQRLMLDMHDGLGLHLVAALQLANDPCVPRDTLSAQLRETLDHLKLTVDAMQDTEGDIASLLGALRYRLGPRLQAANIELSWTIEPLPHLAAWTLHQSRNLQMLLYEAFSNVMMHAGASHATFRAAPDAHGSAIRIVLSDNGRGLAPAPGPASAGHGIRNMHTRARRLGATLDIVNTASGTDLVLLLPFTAQ